MKLLTVRRGVATVAALGLILACHAGEPSAPASDRIVSAPALGVLAKQGTDEAKTSKPLDQRDERPAVCSPRKAVSNSGVFGPSGGTLTFGGSSLIIPGGALRDTVTITATTAADSTARADFEPEGLRFYKPAGLVLDASACALDGLGKSMSVVYLAQDGTVLERIPAVYSPQWKVVAAPIMHFSGYAIAF